MKTKQIFGRKIVCSEFKYSDNSDLQYFFDTGIQKCIQNFPDNCIIVLGGDGTMLEALREFKNKKLPFLGINFGTKGFLMHPQKLTQSNDYIAKKYPLLFCRIGAKKVFAFNEFDIKASEGKMLDMKITINKEFTQDIVGDGLIISSAIGSSGYSSSLGGALLPEGSNAYILTPKAPWKPKGLSPVLLDELSEVSIEIQGRNPNYEVYADGQVLKVQKNILRIGVEHEAMTLLIHRTYETYWKNRMYIEQGFLDKKKAIL